MKINRCIALFISSFLVTSIAHAWDAEKLASNLSVPWGLAYVNENTMLVTERNGTIKRVDLITGKHTVIAKPQNVWAQGQGGLLDIALSPFDNSKIYITYSKDVEGEGSTTLAQATFLNGVLSEWKDLFITKSRTDTGRHFGSRITFDNESIYFSIGDRGDRDNGQNTMTHAGTILRLKPDGSTPTNNPYIGDNSILDEIWSYGHRNPQGLFYDSKNHNLWSIEHGPRGGDEINLIKKGANYGWPVTSHGKEYWGPISVGDSLEKEGIESPVKVYIPSIAPSSLVLYRGDKFPQLNGKLLAGALKLTHMNVITIDGANNVVSEQRLFEDMNERIRDIEVSPQGDIFFSTDNGNLYRLKN